MVGLCCLTTPPREPPLGREQNLDRLQYFKGSTTTTSGITTPRLGDTYRATLSGFEGD
jgi:hypothetical protein